MSDKDMKNDDKKEKSTSDSSNNTNKEGKSETVDSENIKIKIGTFGNLILAVFILVIIGTGGLTYYLIHSAKNDYDQQYNDIVSNLSGNSVQNETDEEVTTVANIIDSALSDVTLNSNSSTNNNVLATDDTARKTLNESLVVLYDGLILDTSKMDEVTLQYIDSKSDQSDKFVITYYSYENYSFKESKLGTLSTPIGEGLVKIDGVGKIAISEDYDAVPRNIKVVNTIPTIVSTNNSKVSEYDTVKTIITDFDGNGSNEYILILANKTTGFSKITLFDSKGAKIADLASIEKSKWKQDTNTAYYLSLSNVEIIDVDNDGIMEIVVEIPHATGNPTVSLLKYNNGVLDGKTNIECSLLSE